MFYSWTSSDYLKSLYSIFYIGAPSLVVLLAFLISTDVPFGGMAIIFAVTMIYGFYINYDIRRVVRGNFYEAWVEES